MKSKTILLLGLTLSLLTGCGKDASQAAFTGTWKITEENSITMATETQQIVVNSLPPKFRLATVTPSSDDIMVYDGASKHTNYLYKGEPQGDSDSDPEPSSEATSEAGSAPQKKSEPMNENQAAAERFWVIHVAGDSSPGGLVAGRDTLLYESKWKRPDGEFSNQVWVDAKTGVLLKSVESIYSSQAQMLVRRSLKECVSIDYTPPGEATFVAP